MRMLHAVRRQPVASDLLAPREGGVLVPQTAVRLAPVHVVKCDGCGAEHHAVPHEAYEGYVPFDWLEHGNTHRCPACRSPEDLEAERVARDQWIDDGLTIAQVRQRLEELHAKEAQGSGDGTNRGRRGRTRTKTNRERTQTSG